MPIRLKRGISRALCYILLSVASLIVLVPLFLIVINSLKSYTESQVVTLSLPAIPLFSNYIDTIVQGGVLRAMANGLIITSSATILSVIFSSMSAFILMRRVTGLTKFLYMFFIAGLIAPLSVIPEMEIIKTLHLTGTYFAIIFVHLANNIAFPTFLTAGFVKSLPREIDESAFIDGCSPLTMFFRIILPMLKPVLFTCIILTFLGIWNDFQYSIYFITQQTMYTMPQTIYAFVGFHTMQYQYVCADLVIAALPVLILYLLSQRFIVAGMTIGAVKG